MLDSTPEISFILLCEITCLEVFLVTWIHSERFKFIDFQSHSYDISKQSKDLNLKTGFKIFMSITFYFSQTCILECFDCKTLHNIYITYKVKEKYICGRLVIYS